MILLTGASGFIGQHLVKMLANKFGRENIVLLTTKQHEGYNCFLHNDFILEEDSLNRFGMIETVIHAGAFTPKSQNESQDWSNCTSNIVNTSRLLDLLKSPPRRFIFLSTLDVYENTYSLINEDSKVNPSSLYGHSKLYCERMVESWARHSNITIQILRIGHIYGPGEEAYAKIIPITIINSLKGISPTIYSDGSEKRSFLYIDDCCEYITRSLELSSYEGPINVVSSQSISIMELTHKIIDFSSSSISPIVLDQKIQTRDFIFDSAKLTRLLGNSTVTIEEGLTKEIEYFRRLL